MRRVWCTVQCWGSRYKDRYATHFLVCLTKGLEYTSDFRQYRCLQAFPIKNFYKMCIPLWIKDLHSNWGGIPQLEDRSTYVTVQGRERRSCCDGYSMLAVPMLVPKVIAPIASKKCSHCFSHSFSMSNCHGHKPYTCLWVDQWNHRPTKNVGKKPLYWILSDQWRISSWPYRD